MDAGSWMRIKLNLIEILISLDFFSYKFLSIEYFQFIIDCVRKENNAQTRPLV